jgi:Dyp-type peroxidase family
MSKVGTDIASAAKEAVGNIQAHLLRPSKFPGDKTRNWSLFFFFRILPQAEYDATINRIRAAAAPATSDDDASVKLKLDKERKLWLDFAQPAFTNAGVVDQGLADRAVSASPASAASASLPAPDAPAQSFLDWLKVLASADKSAFLRDLTRLIAASGPSLKNIEVTETEAKNLNVASLLKSVADINSSQRLDPQQVSQWLEVYSEKGGYFDLLDKVGQGLGAMADTGSLGTLPIITLYEVLRQGALAMSNDSNQPRPGMVRSEADVAIEDDSVDVTPINIAFTYSGLAALKLNEITLASFTDAFKQGMAARAQRLHDDGPSAPETWEGELGLPSVHGYFTGGFAIGDHLPRDEKFWKSLRAGIAAFNDPIDERGELLRFWLRLIFRGLGLEILHIELGQDPYGVDAQGQIEDISDRLEHFGFRDGLSQPFVDLGLGDTASGGGNPSRNGTWTPIAPGEIFLNLPDEDDTVQHSPLSRELTVGSTFVVFRKLEQDVVGFRAFLHRQHRHDREKRDALAAQIVGRWPNGTPLVLSPETARRVHHEAALNDFRYAADDPLGRKCPLGAHIRRANPRDIGGRDEVRRHRILRRGISYGGPLLAEDSPDDGEDRGLLFIAANSRIDLQFEVIQADWINKGEFLGQAGLGRCPLTGANDGEVTDSFLEANTVAPITRLPRFVETRGGDYFFAPGLKALKLISDGHQFEPEPGETPFDGLSMNDATTPALFDPDRLKQYAHTILPKPTDAAIRVVLPPSATDERAHISFVGQHRDVTAVLKNDDESGQLAFSVRHYRDAAHYLTRGQDLLFATETGPARQRLKTILDEAWRTLYSGYGKNEQAIDAVLRNAACAELDMAIRRTAQLGRIDLMNDLASRASYAVVRELFGMPGPSWLTELGASLPFARQHAGELPPDWIIKLQGNRPDDAGFMTMQIWSTLIVADLIGNVQSVTELHALSRQAGSEMLTHIDGLLSMQRRKVSLGSPKGKPPGEPRTLIDAFVKLEGDIVRGLASEVAISSDKPSIAECYRSFGSGWTEVYYRDAAAILLELAGSTMAGIPMAFASVVGSLFKFRIDLPALLPKIMKEGGDGVTRLIYEAERLNPMLPVRMRYCERATKLPSGATIAEGDWVGAMIAAANLDPRVFENPHLISLDRDHRDLGKYLLFNEPDSKRECWGRSHVAMAVLQECVVCAGRLKGLRRVAGPSGEPAKLVRVAVSLPARFTRVDPKLSDSAGS